MSAGAVTVGPPDAPPVMLIHGLGGSYRVWDRVVPLIEPAARIYAVELESTASIDRDADDAAALIDTPTVLVGHSRGGLVATAIAERHPGLARKLILVCPPWSLTSRLSANRPIERALAVPGIGDLLHLTVLPGIGHTPPWEAPHHVAELITEQPRGGLPAAAPGARVQAGARRAAAAPAGGLPAGRRTAS